MYHYILGAAVVLAQASNTPSVLTPNPDPLSGNSGWVGTGLLGTVLAWLLFVHLPGKDKLIKEMNETKDGQIKEMNAGKDKQLHDLTERYEKKLEQTIEAFKQQGQETKTEFRNALSSIIEHCRKETSDLITAFHKEMTYLTDHLRPPPGTPATPFVGKGGNRPPQPEE